MKNKEEYMVHIWGGAWNSDSNPSIEKDLGIRAGYYYFDTEEEKNKFCKPLDNPIYSKQGIARDIKHGIMTHKRTIFVEHLRLIKIINYILNLIKNMIQYKGIVDAIPFCYLRKENKLCKGMNI